MEFLDIPLFDDDLAKLLFRFSLNIIFITIIVRYLYYTAAARRDYLFTFYMISIIVFFLCFTLKKYEIDIGMALGLFAIFGIIRYRTDPIPIKEMTYLFVVIGLSVINALANKKMSYAEILVANVATAGAVAILEYVWKAKALRQINTKKIDYGNLEKIKPESRAALILELEEITGLRIERIKVGNISLIKNSATITIYYFNGN